MPDFNTLLAPFLERPMSPEQLELLRRYLELLLKWNARISLTSLRNPEEIIRRHFGESLFAGQQLRLEAVSTLIDLGSGAGFPGLPIKILAPHVEVTLIESQQKKVAFLREAIRALALSGVNVHAGRAEDSQLSSQIVIMRAVEKWETALEVAASLIVPSGTLALLIGSTQAARVSDLLPSFAWGSPVPLPESRERIFLAGSKAL